eukprot:134290_1
MSPSLNAHNTIIIIHHVYHSCYNTLHLLYVDTTAPPDDPSNNNVNPNDDLFIAPRNAAINNPMLNNGAHYTLNAMDAAVAMNRADHNDMGPVNFGPSNLRKIRLTGPISQLNH